MNPFYITQYGGPHYFCDREDDLNLITKAFEGNRSLLLFSLRRMGKTGLIKHFHYHLRKKKHICIYADMLNTTSDEDFINNLANAALAEINQQNKNPLESVIKFFGQFKPRIYVDQLTGNPGIEMDIKSEQDVTLSLDAIFNILEKQGKKVQIAIDEFQQISSYQDSTIDATLRKQLQKNKNCHFIFSGSQRHILLALFNDTAKPMFRSVQQMQIGPVPYPSYFSFIKRLFGEVHKTIDDQVVHNILTWTRGHTYYVQYLCNRLYESENDGVNENDFNIVTNKVLNELQMNFLSYKNILSKNQFKMLVAVAKEGEVSSVRNSKFLTKYKMSGSTANQSLKYLVDKELMSTQMSIEKTTYQVYDVFLNNWLRKWY